MALTWESTSTSVVMFDVVRDGVKIKTVPGNLTSCPDFDIASGVSHEYCVVAVTAHEDESPSACDTGHRELRAPTAVDATDNVFEDRVMVTWNDESEFEAGYRIYRKEAGSNADSIEIGTTLPNREAFIDETGMHGVDYEYGVTAFDALGESGAASDIGSRVLLSPTSVEASQGEYEDQIMVTWEDRSFAEDGYVIRRDDVVVDSVAANGASYSDTGVVFGMTHTYSVAAFDDFGASAPGLADGFTTISAPGTVSASDVYPDRVIVTWIDNSDIEALYEILRDGAPIGSVAVNVTSYADTTGMPEVEYDYCVRAVSGGASSDLGCDGGHRTFSSTNQRLAEDQIGCDDCNGLGSSVAVNGYWAMAVAPDTEPGGSVRQYSYSVNLNHWEDTTHPLFFNPPLQGCGNGVNQLQEGQVALHGYWAVVGIPGVCADFPTGVAYFFRGQGNTYVQSGVPVQGSDVAAEDSFGSSVDVAALSQDLGHAVIANHRPSPSTVQWAYIFEYAGLEGQWYEVAALHELVPPDDDDYTDFGTSVCIDNSGDFAAVAAHGNAGGMIYVFERTGDQIWEHHSTIHSSERFASVAFDGDVLIAGVPDDGNGGSAFLYSRSGNVWTQEAQLLPSDLDENQRFGVQVDLWQDYAFVSRVGGPVPQQHGVYVFFDDLVFGWTEQYKLVSEIDTYEDNGFAGSMDATFTFDGKGSVMTGAPLDGTGVVHISDYASPGGVGVVVTASDGTFENRVRVEWTDPPTSADGFRIYRDGQEIETLGSENRSFNDFDAEPGKVHEYCVATFVGGEGEVSSRCDFGWRPPDGNITGRVSTRTGAPIDSVSVCIEPVPNSALLFDGSDGRVIVENVAAPQTAMTVEFWLKSSDALHAGTPFSYAHGSEVNSIVVRDHRNFEVFVAGAGTGPLGVSADDGDWHHIAVTWRNSDGLLEIYKDGNLENSANVATGQDIPDGGVLVLGQNLGAGPPEDRALLGQLDEVRVWNYGRSGADIQAAMSIPLGGDEDGLLAYWTADAGEGPVMADRTPGNRYAFLEGGVFWTDDAAPLEICALTDLEGNYAISSIRYGNGTTFKVVPSRGSRTFEPAFKTITLNRQSPIQNEVAFTDITSFAVSGFVRFRDTSCFVDGVSIYVDDAVAGITDAEGNYTVAVQPGLRRIEARLGDHTFEQATVDLLVTGDTAGISFLDTTRRTLIGRVGGGCGRGIGDLTLEVTSESGCLDPEQFVTESNYDFSLPPQKYFIRVADVQNVPDELDRADILAFFENLGAKIVDLTEDDAVENFTFRAPLSIVVSGFPPPACNGETITDPETGVAFAGVPIIPQGTPVQLTIEVFEDYGNGNRCPVDSGTVTIFDEIQDVVDDPLVLEIRDGKVQYTTVGNSPNTVAGRRDSQGNDRSYQKPLTAAASVEGQDDVQAINWAIVTGDRPRTGTFLTALAEEIPLLILRDPPGDGSSAFFERGSTTTTTFSETFLESPSLSFSTELKAGIKFEKGLPFFSTATKVQVIERIGIQIGVEATQGGEMLISTSTTERFSTSDDELFVGSDGDVFMGVGLNLVFAKTDVLQIDEQACEVQKTQSIRFGGDQDDTFRTVYLYTDNHIRSTLIPQLEEAAELDTTNAVLLTSSVVNWRKQLARNDSLKAQAVVKDNRSFSAGAEQAFESTTTRGRSTSSSVKVFTDDSYGRGLGFEESGNEGELFLAANFKFERDSMSVTDSVTTITTGYNLSDDDIGDYFTVDVAEDLVYGTPVFRLRSGRSSCPWEPGTQPRDSSAIAIEPPTLADMPPDEPAVFTLTIFNWSPSEELREYTLRPILTSNPGGAVLKVNGRSLGGGEQFFIPGLGPNQSQEVTLTVDRGPTRFFYDDLALQVVPPCEFERFRNGGPLQLADTVSFSVAFKAPCSDVTLFEPRSGWAFNEQDALETNDTLRLTLDGFELKLSETDSLESVGAEYRLVNTQFWKPIGPEVLKGDIPTFPNGEPKSVQIAWSTNGPHDGTYELRAFTSCGAGRAYSGIATGVIDRKPPERFGTPEPADTTLALGDEVSISFNEKIDCSTVTPDRVTLEYVESDTSTVPVLLELFCDGTTILIEPNEAVLPLLEGEILIARVEGIEDLAGNPMADAESWSFEVRQSAFLWADESVLQDVAFRSPGTVSAELVNGTNEDLEFTLTGLPEWLTVPSATDSIRSGESLLIDFSVADSLGLGTHEITVIAEVDNPPLVAPLDIRVDVGCVEPVWAVDIGGFEQTMSIATRISIGGAASSDPDDMLAAFVGNQLRGLATPTEIMLGNQIDHIYFMTVHSNRVGGETIRFQVWDDSACRLYTATNRTFGFVADGSEGSPEAPETMIATDAPTGTIQVIAMNEGWTWFSLNLLRPQDMSVNGLLGDLNPGNGDLIKSQDNFSQFTLNAGWVGDLATLDNISGYAIKLSEAGTLVHDGTAISPDSLEIPVFDGWNWIGYVPKTPLEVNLALDGLDPTAGDIIKSQSEFAQYVSQGNTKIWLGTLDTMRPGLGYKLRLANADATQNGFFYPVPAPPPLLLADGSMGSEGVDDDVLTMPSDPSSGRAGLVKIAPELVVAAAKSDPGSPGWSVNPRAYQYSMTMTGLVSLDGQPLASEDVVVGAFVNDEVRGVAGPQYIPQLDRHLVFVMVHSNAAADETVVFKVYDPAEDMTRGVTETVGFQADGVLGTAQTPFVFTALQPESGNLPLLFGMGQNYPNPLIMGKVGTIRYALPRKEHVVLKVYDVQGRNVLRLVDEEQPAGWYAAELDPRGLASGLYFYRIEAGRFVDVKKMMLLR